MYARNGAYYCDFRVAGRRVRKSLSRNLRVAKQLLTELQARAQRGEYGLLDNDFPVSDLKEQYLQHCRQTLKPSTVERYEHNLAAILPGLPTRVAQMSTKAILDFRDRRLTEGVSPRTINMDVSALAAVFCWGVEQRLIANNPLVGIKPLRNDHPKDGRPLTNDEVQHLLESSPQPWRDIWYALLVTGLRKTELAHLTFSDIDWDSRDLTVQKGIAKNHNARRIPIEAGLWEILGRLRDERDRRRPGRGTTPEITAEIVRRFTKDHVFVTTQTTPITHGSGIWHAFMRCCRLAGIEIRTLNADGRETEHVDVHSCRRTFATNLITAGADPKTVQELLGHKTLAMTMNIYAKIHSGTKRQAVGRLTYGTRGQGVKEVLNYPSQAVVGHNLATPRPAAAG
jgi:integrase/recombinase XerD